jgi:glycosyltransferase involved in cell wall biosynthesis
VTVAEFDDNGKISVVIPSRNRAPFLDVAIASVLRSPVIVSPRNVIVVDDDSRDATPDVARRWGVRYRRVCNRNISHTRNAGLTFARTTYVTFLDDDDAWLPGNMEAQLAALERHPDAAFAYGILQCATEDLEPLASTVPRPPLASGRVAERLHLNYPNLGVVLFRRQAVLDFGGFDPRIPYYQDADLMLRIAARREIVGVDVVGMLHRLRSPSKSRSDYYWTNRDVIRWRPKLVGWKAATKFQVKIRGMYYRNFCEDAIACARLGHRRDALKCFGRALRISPARALRHARDMASVFNQCLGATRGRQSTA